MAEFKWFKNTNTGLVGNYPADFADLFYDTFVEVDPDTHSCIDCAIPPVEDEEQDVWGMLLKQPTFIPATDEKNKDNK